MPLATFKMLGTSVPRGSQLQRLRNFLEENGILNATDEDLENAWIKFSNEKIFTNWTDMDGYNLKRFLQCSHRYL